MPGKHKLVHVVDDYDGVRRSLDFLQKPTDREHVLAAVKRAFDSMTDCEEQRNRADWVKTQIGQLTLREQEVLDGLACGYPSKTIAYDVGSPEEIPTRLDTSKNLSPLRLRPDSMSLR